MTTESVLASEERAMIRAVLLDPFDDGPRLILADWYEEHGQAGKACYIRREVERDTPTVLGPMRAIIINTHDDEPPIMLRSAVGGQSAVLHLRRGSVSEWHCTLDDFLAHAERLFSEQPIERVVLTDRRPINVAPPGMETFGWYRGHAAPSLGRRLSPFQVPAEIFGNLPGQRPVWADAAYSTTSEQALADLSQACVAYGRSLAGLPPLPERKEPCR